MTRFLQHVSIVIYCVLSIAPLICEGETVEAICSIQSAGTSREKDVLKVLNRRASFFEQEIARGFCNFVIIRRFIIGCKNTVAII